MLLRRAEAAAAVPRGPALLLLLLLCVPPCAARLGAARARALSQRGGAWPPANLISRNPASPPAWALAPEAGWGPALAATEPAPVAPGSVLPGDAWVANAAYHEGAVPLTAAQLQAWHAAHGGKAADDWWAPPANAVGTAASLLRGLQGYRPLTMVDAKGGEYALDKPGLDMSK